MAGRTAKQRSTKTLEQRLWNAADTAWKSGARSPTTAEIIAELVKIAKTMRTEHARHKSFELREDEAAFRDAVRLNDPVLLAGAEVQR